MALTNEREEKTNKPEHFHPRTFFLSIDAERNEEMHTRDFILAREIHQHISIKAYFL